ncbi:hypothetical protein PoB_000561900 [Plakobranchus ocellatus]|uniref:Uncharacterized protein n=1 Tax=Plakobranchus ocellatus TaxID=259542 RepID=A0AAV3YA09_9GAST|nr:hypothetical protein PoB_000561900 [Plakobranchus ocellatus]
MELAESGQKVSCRLFIFLPLKAQNKWSELQAFKILSQVYPQRSRGRQREKIMDGLATWLGPGKVSDILAAVKDRDLWRDMIANAYKQGT